MAGKAPPLLRCTPVILGNSLGGVNAYQFAARYPERVRALVIEDMGCEIAGDLSFVLDWEGIFESRQDLEARLGPRMSSYLSDSVRHTAEGWTLAFEPRDMIASKAALNGDYWPEWLATDCPALLIRGADSRVTEATHIEEMAARRPNTSLVTLPGGHVVHVDDPAGFAKAVQSFLESSLLPLAR